MSLCVCLSLSTHIYLYLSVYIYIHTNFLPAQLRSPCCKDINVLCVQDSDKYYRALDLYWSASGMYTHSTSLSLNIWSPKCVFEWQITSEKSAAITGNNVPISPSPPLYLPAPSLPLVPIPPCPAYKHIPLIDFPLTPSRLWVSAHPDAQTPMDWLQT